MALTVQTVGNFHRRNQTNSIFPGIPTTIKTMGVNITTVANLRVLIIELGQTIMLMVVEAQGIGTAAGKYTKVTRLLICSTLQPNSI